MKHYYLNNIKKIKRLQKIWHKNNIIKVRKIRKRVYVKSMLNPKFRINASISSMIRRSLKNKKYRHWETLVGFTINDLMMHLKKQFKDGMTWDNYGMKGWSIDHIKPISSFNFISYEDKEFKKCWALENLQPLWAEENLRKSNKILEDKNWHKGN